MDNKNTIVIESSAYIKKVKYFWKNGDGTLSDLADNINSPFSKSKPQYKQLSEASLGNIAYQVVKTIEESYNRQEGLHIEVNGAEEDYLAIKGEVEGAFAGRQMDCKWGKRLEPPQKAEQKIKKIYSGLAKKLSEYDGEGAVRLCDRNDERGWLRFGFDRDNVASKAALYVKCGMAGGYLQRIIEEIKDETGKTVNKIYELEQNQKEEQAPSPQTKKDPEKDKEMDRLQKSIRKICDKEKREAGRELADMLKGSFANQYLDKKRIADRVNDGMKYAQQHPDEWKKSFPGDDLAGQFINKQRCEEYTKTLVVRYFNEDIEKYTAKINEMGESFWRKKTEELKKKLCEEICGSDKFTVQQKEMVRQCALACGEAEVSHGIAIGKANTESKVDEEQFRWKKKAFDEKDICWEYKNKLYDEVRNRNKNILNRNDAVFNAWEGALVKKLMNTGLDIREDGKTPGRADLEYYERKKEKLLRLLELFQEGRRKIDAMISFQ